MNLCPCQWSCSGGKAAACAAPGGGVKWAMAEANANARASAKASGPLVGLKVIELAGIGPGPLCAMLLADMGAEVLTIDRPRASGLGLPQETRHETMRRGRRSLAVDLKHRHGAEVVLRLVERSDALLEPFRPGVAERLRIGPADCLARNPRLVYGRITGWGQDGPLAPTAGHDIDYIALTGVLDAIGPVERPLPPLNLIGDFGGGALYLAMGLLAALWERERSGRGQIVDAAMVDGAASLATMFFGMRAAGTWRPEREANPLDGGAPFYGVYETADGRHLAIGAIEPKFFAALLAGLGIADVAPADQMRRATWPAQRARIATAVAERTRDEWAEHFAGTDACVAPVLSFDEAPRHPHNRARDAFAMVDDIVQPAPAPRFSRTPSAIQGPPPEPGADTDEALAAWGFAADEIAELRRAGAIGRRD